MQMVVILILINVFIYLKSNSGTLFDNRSRQRFLRPPCIVVLAQFVYSETKVDTDTIQEVTNTDTITVGECVRICEIESFLVEPSPYCQVMNSNASNSQRHCCRLGIS